MQEFIQSVPEAVWWILGAVIAPSFVFLISVISILSIAVRATGGNFSLKLPFGAHLEMGISPSFDRRSTSQSVKTKQ